MCNMSIHWNYQHLNNEMLKELFEKSIRLPGISFSNFTRLKYQEYVLVDREKMSGRIFDVIGIMLSQSQLLLIWFHISLLLL